MSQTLQRHREIWKKKKILRVIYSDWYKKILNDLKPGGKTVELGAGSGNFKEFKPGVIATDIEPCAWLDMCFDAHQMPFQDNEVANLVMVDVLHHLADPIKFMEEAYRVLEPGGRVLMLEPFPSPFSRIIYKIVHPEPFEYNIDYFSGKRQVEKDTWDSNQAIPYLLFFKQLEKFNNCFDRKFRIIRRKKTSFILYPASGGFENRQLWPDKFIGLGKVIELALVPLRPFLAFRCYVIIEKIN